MKVCVNGEEVALPDGASVARLLELLALDAKKVAVERNGKLVRRAEHASALLAEGDSLELVTLVGGG